MKKKLSLILSALLMVSSVSGCGEKQNDTTVPETDSSPVTQTTEQKEVTTVAENTTQEEITTQPPHISPIENLSVKLGTQQTIDRVIQREEGSNTIQLPLSDFIEDGDVIESFTFIVYSTDGSDIGTYKGGCGISVSSECPSATNEGWYQSDNFSSETQGSYGEIVWNVPAEIRDYVPASGDFLFGYWWGNVGSVRLDSVICTFTRTRDIPVDGVISYKVGKSVNYSDTNNFINVAQSEFLPENTVPEAVTYNISTSGSFGKFTGAFGYQSSEGYYQSYDIAVFTEGSELSLTWFVPETVKDYITDNGEIFLGYWWSNQPSITLNSIEVKYSEADISVKIPTEPQIVPVLEGSTGFRSSSEIVNEIKVGWNLGNSFESYDTGKSGLSTETAWGNPKTTQPIIQSVKNSGFNAIRIPVTWGEHMDGDTIQTEWLDRVQEVVNYAYNEDMFVIINIHHDDYIWLNPLESEYEENSKKFKAIWEQISERFKNYGDTLLFEGMNEVRTIGSAGEWSGGTAEERAVIDKLNQDFVNTVRASGGNNAERTLIVTSYAASAEESALKDLVIPNDKHVILSVHYYAPWDFAEGKTTEFGETAKEQLSAKFSYLKTNFIDKGTPVIIGEFGCVAAASDSVRADYYNNYVNLALNCGIKCFVWDNGVSTGESSYGIFYRKSLTWNTMILNAIMNDLK